MNPQKRKTTEDLAISISAKEAFSLVLGGFFWLLVIILIFAGR